ncbi:DegT/DnrJ/EryC1/StrS family aminotransferase [Chitinivorax sp. B]|uniref:DegT/DnrJ/EryC1/StrS family aminotransferase n=1 Tax=Chitinivorax sp. B TaxID=2502235 RepID=UPI0010FA4470|nr:DegT/DnrJ/EryC1/StrS family aminotransferase [Chitinivorax sp. B]
MHFDRPIGGFFELELPAPQSGNLLAHWQADALNSRWYANARSALAHLLRHKQCTRVWLPAYLCDALVDAILYAGCRVQFYPVDEQLHPDSNWLVSRINTGDAVLAIDYFGRSPNSLFRGLVQSRQDVIWIEDRAQAIDTGQPPWGTWQLFSPRKLLGVPDGGLLVGPQLADLPTPHGIPPIHVSAWLRREDSHGSRNSEWYGRFKQDEADMDIDLRPASKLTQHLLACTPAHTLIQARRQNYARYQAALPYMSFLGETRAFVPFGFVIRTPHADALWQHLIDQRIFAQRHWRELSTAVEEFPVAHQLAGELLTLPCDHRLNNADVDRVIAAIQVFFDE